MTLISFFFILTAKAEALGTVHAVIGIVRRIDNTQMREASNSVLRQIVRQNRQTIVACCRAFRQHVTVPNKTGTGACELTLYERQEFLGIDNAVVLRHENKHGLPLNLILHAVHR